MATAGSAPGGASRDAVLNTTELLEACLLRVSPRDLLVNVQRVSKTWREAIHGSITLRQRLFISTADTKDLLASSPDLAESMTSMITTVENGVAFDITNKSQLYYSNRQMPPQSALHFVVNPLALRAFLVPSKTIVRKSKNESKKARDTRESFQQHARVWQYPEASYRRQLVSHPPVKKLGVKLISIGPKIRSPRLYNQWENSNKDGFMGVKSKLEAEGVTMGDVYDRLLERAKEARSSEIMVAQIKWLHPDVDAPVRCEMELEQAKIPGLITTKSYEERFFGYNALLPQKRVREVITLVNL